MSLANRVCIITGASSGIGAEIARCFVKEGATVVLVGRNIENLNSVSSDCISINRECQPFVITADNCSDNDIKNVVDSTLQKFGKIDVLINNSGIIGIGSIENTSMEQYDQIMDTNIRSMYQLTMLAVPHLIETKGTIVNISSVNGIRAFSGVLAYCISKAAVDQFTRCIALELAPKGVRVNSVNPGVVITDIHKRGGMSEERYQEFLEHSKETHALGRPGEVKEVAEAVLFLATSKSSFVTGVNLPVDGGRHAMVTPFDK